MVLDDPSITYDQPMEPGYWQPVGNPPVPMLAPWLGSVDPLVVDDGYAIGQQTARRVAHELH